MSESEFEESELRAKEIFERLAAQDYDSVASQFGYALCFNSPPSAAIESDLVASLNEIGASLSDLKGAEMEFVHKQFSEDSALKSTHLVELWATIADKGSILVELMHPKQGSPYLEQISSFTT